MIKLEKQACLPLRKIWRKLQSCIVLTVLISGCANQKLEQADIAAYPLQACASEANRACVTPFFDPLRANAISERNPEAFPQRYLELYDVDVQREYCEKFSQDLLHFENCKSRLKQLAAFFNPKGKPDKDRIGVALEGGGTKSAQFSLGVLAGLQELGLLEENVGAVSSISGGSYAASYLFNRYFDQLSASPTAGGIDQWFESCIPDFFMSGPKQHHFRDLYELVKPYNCYERIERDGNYEFKNHYTFVGHVWTNHDLLMGQAQSGLRAMNDWRLPEYANLAELTGETLLWMPFQFLSRAVFHWPINNAPSKHAYKLGLERSYGYTPDDWSQIKDRLVETNLCQRRTQRTLAAFRDKLANNPDFRIPNWILGVSAPSGLRFDEWLTASPRDPVRQLFELSWSGSGSGTYGYTHAALAAPTDLYDLPCQTAHTMSIVDAVEASAAFFDEQELLIDQQPLRLLGGIVQQFLDVTWFSEIPNYNQDLENGIMYDILPYPFYMFDQESPAKSPSLHFQDGGNTENTGILPLLRRGYQTIIYSHSTQDTLAQWSDICHLKNQLEVDGQYYLHSRDFEMIMQGHDEFLQTSGRDFKSYLDGFCSAQLDESDLVAFAKNPKRTTENRWPALAQLFCNRLTPAHLSNEEDLPCREFTDQLWNIQNSLGGSQVENTSFYDWPSNRTISFQVYRRNTAGDKSESNQETLLSNIIAITPAVSWQDVTAQLTPFHQDHPIHNWREWCETSPAIRQAQTIKYCFGPKHQLLSAQDGIAPQHGLPCTALAYLLNDACQTDLNYAHPKFPQDSFVLETLREDYTTYAAYFDLARHLVRESICSVAQPNRQFKQKCE